MTIVPYRFVTPMKIAATYIGTIVGAGFASGQEVLKFFAYFGYKGIIGGILATLLFSIFGIYILYLSHRIKANSYEDILVHIMGPKFGRIVDLILTVFLLCTLGVMLAGAGAIFSEHLGLAKNFGIILTTILTMATLFYGLKGIMNANTILVPIMLLLLIFISCYSLYSHGFDLKPFEIYEPNKAAAPHWLLSVFLYVGYNLILTTAVLAPMGGQISNLKDLILGGLLGGLGLGLLIVLLTAIVINHFPQVGNFEVPILYITETYSWQIKLFLAFILWTEIFTTVIGNAYGFIARVTALTGQNRNTVMLVTMFVAVIFSQLGFSVLVSIIYPLLGYLSLVFLIALIKKAIL